jgi:pimeloyl-ACP methyl ester carboxylesterase
MVAVPGSPSPMRLYVALPPEYGQAAYAHRRFPVVELFHGYPGTPTTWFHAMDVLARLRQAQAAGATPFVLVIPQISVSGAPDLECTDLPGQPQVATFLTTEVHAVVTSHFRVRADSAGWALMGYSEGGYCAAQLTLRHPELFAAGVDIAGYDRPLSALFDRYPAQRAAGRLSTLLRSAPPVAIYASASAQDPQSSGGLTILARDARPPTTVTARLYAQGGHNTSDWSAQLPGDFLWLSRHVGGVVG